MRIAVVAAALAALALAPGVARADPTRLYCVREGDYLAKIAQAFGVDEDAIWDHPENASVRARRDPNILRPGDVLAVPWPVVSLARPRVERPRTTRIRLVFSGSALERFVATGLPVKVDGTLDAQGTLDVDVPVELRQFTVLLVKHNISYPILVGNMEPVDDVGGARKRLQNLGFVMSGRVDGLDERDRAAVEAFQRSKGLPVTGIVDGDTADALVDAHGS